MLFFRFSSKSSQMLDKMTLASVNIIINGTNNPVINLFAALSLNGVFKTLFLK